MKRKLFALLAVLALFVGGACSDDDEPAVEAGGDSTEQAEDDYRLTITMDDRKFLDFPATLEGGLLEITAKNDGKLNHEASFINVDKDYAVADFVKEFKVVVAGQGAPIPSTFHPYFGPFDSIEPGTSVTANQSLPAGDYFLICTLTDADSNEDESEPARRDQKLPLHMEQGMATKVKVTGPATVAPPTGLSTSVTAKEYSFDVKGLTAGKNEVLFVNDPAAKEIHMAAVMEFPEGVDEAAAKKAVEAFSGDGPPPPGTPEPEEAGFSGVFDPGGFSVFKLDLKANRVYAFLCFIQDRNGGPPHVAKGMVTFATVK